MAAAEGFGTTCAERHDWHARADGLAQGDEGFADGGRAQRQGFEHQHHAVEDHPQRAAFLGRLDHAARHVVERR